MLFVAISLFWGIPYFFIKIAVKAVDPSIVVCTRVGIAAVVLMPVAWFRGALRQLAGQILPITGLTLVQIAIPFLLISYGEQHIASSLASLIIAAEPMLVALFALHFDRAEQVDGVRFVGLVIGAAGVAVLFGLDIGGGSMRLVGAFMVLIATCCYAASALMLRASTYSRLPSLGVVAVECAITTILLAPIAATRLPTHMPGADVVVSLLVLGLVCTALAELTFFALVAEVGASKGTVFTYVNPVVSVLLGVAFLAEPLSVSTVFGFVLIIFGSYLSTAGRLPAAARRARPAPAAPD